MKMKKWEAVAFQEFSQWFILDIDNKGNWIFTDLTIATIKRYKRILDIFCRNDL